jgi:hypothetical protein
MDACMYLTKTSKKGSRRSFVNSATQSTFSVALGADPKGDASVYILSRGHVTCIPQTDTISETRWQRLETHSEGRK